MKETIAVMLQNCPSVGVFLNCTSNKKKKPNWLSRNAEGVEV